MSKYDKLEYISQYENINKTYPDCVKQLSKEDIKIPEELLEGVTIEELKKYIKLENEQDKSNFRFFNNNQTQINNDYFKNAKYPNNNMTLDEKKEFLIDYLIFYYGNKVDGEYFENNLIDIFNLKDKNIEKNDFDFMIQNHFKKNEIDLNDDEDRNKFKEIINDIIFDQEGNNNFNNIDKGSDDYINTKI